jgi:uncharacterized repeat protein (TIGR01451 family)
LALAAPPAARTTHGSDTFAVTWNGKETVAAVGHYVADYFANEPAGTITNTVTVNSSTNDPNTLNNTAVQTTTVTSQADLSITKSDGVASVLPGTTITYTIVVANAGPSAVTGAGVVDLLPAAITGATWTCSAAVGSSCDTASGSDDINTTINLAVNGTATFTVVADVAWSAAGTLENTAAVAPPVNTVDPDLNNNQATDTDTLLTGTLTGTVYLDTSGDAGYDSGEGLDGITVVITTSVGAVFTVTTDIDGNYSVTVPAGATQVDVDDTDLPVGVVQVEGDDPTTVTVPAGGSAGSVDGYEQQGQVTGHIYRDTNGNSNQDSGEPDLGGVQVVITDTFGVAQIVTTDANGNYTATVPVGSTTADVIEATLPAGSVQTEGVDPSTVTATAGDIVSIGIDGYQPQGLVDGTVYMDQNGNGVFDFLTDQPLRDVTVVITDSNGVTYTLITDGDGYFSQIVPSGATTVDVDDSDADLPAGVVLTGGSTDPTTVTVPGGGTATDDTGYVLLASIGDFVWLDLNGDGNQDANEPGLAGVEVILTLPGGGTQTATTGPNGYYTFDDLRPGAHTVAVNTATLPAGLTQTYDPDSTVDDQHNVTISSNDQYEDADFGYQGSASLGDYVWLDSDGDGNQDLSEVGIPGVVITVTFANGWAITATTDAAGDYTFDGLIGGVYTVTVDANTLPTGAVLTTANDPLTVTLGSTQNYTLADFGYQRQAQLTGHLFEDTDGNGVQNGAEPDLPNITLVITDSLGLTQTVVTDANGNYTATVPVDSTTSATDSAIVDVDETTLPAGAVQTAGTDPDTITVTSGTTTDAGDDGYQIQGLIEGVVYTDVNQNGSYDSGTDTPLVGVSVTITDSNGVVYTVPTDSDGYFSQIVPAGLTLVDVSNSGIAAINPSLMIENGYSEPDSATVPGGGSATTNFPYVEPLTIDKDVTTPNVVAGTQVSYQIVVRNIGGAALTNVTISDTLPLSFTYASATFAATSATRTATSDPTVGATVPTWGSWTINPGGQVTINFVADVASDVAAGVYDNTASANSDQTAPVDDSGTTAQDPNTPLGGDPEVDEDVTITTQADLVITKIDDPDPVVAGGTLTYTIQIVNNGPSDAQNVVVADTLSSDTSFVSASPGCSAALGVVTCNLGTVPNGATVDLTIVVTVTPDLLAYGGVSTSAIALAPPPAELVEAKELVEAEAIAVAPAAKEVSPPGADEAALAGSPPGSAALANATFPDQQTLLDDGGGGGPIPLAVVSGRSQVANSSTHATTDIAQIASHSTRNTQHVSTTIST